MDNNFYLSQITIVNGGGRFSSSGRGLLNAQNYNATAAAPFYGRNKRFKVTNVNIIRAYIVGTVEGYGTLNFTNNFVNGGGGLAGQASTYYTNEGISVSDGLSLEFNNNKMVLFRGADPLQVSTAKLLNMKARTDPLLGFNAVTVTGNIFHPRGTETGIDFDADSRTKLGNISGNVFIRTGGTSPLINYTDQALYDNYNVQSIEKYQISSNSGVVDSEPNLKSQLGNSVNTTSTSYVEIVPFNNSDISAMDQSARFGVELELTGVTQDFVAGERITASTGGTALILFAGTTGGGVQKVYIADMSQTFSSAATTWSSASGLASGGNMKFIYRYCEKDPRKLVLNATFSVASGNNEEYYVAPGSDSGADTGCEVSSVINNAGVGGTVSMSCTRRYEEGDLAKFFIKSTTPALTGVYNATISVK